MVRIYFPFFIAPGGCAFVPKLNLHLRDNAHVCSPPSSSISLSVCVCLSQWISPEASLHFHIATEKENPFEIHVTRPSPSGLRRGPTQTPTSSPIRGFFSCCLGTRACYAVWAQQLKLTTWILFTQLQRITPCLQAWLNSVNWFSSLYFMRFATRQAN